MHTKLKRNEVIKYFVSYIISSIIVVLLSVVVLIPKVISIYNKCENTDLQIMNRCLDLNILNLQRLYFNLPNVMLGLILGIASIALGLLIKRYIVSKFI